MRWLLLYLLILSVPATADAQDCDDGTPEGLSPTGEPCRLCLNGSLNNFLPPRTICSEETRYACDANGAYRDECVLVDRMQNPNAPEGATTCSDGAYKGPNCPSGLTCESGFCLATCATDADCRLGFECEDDECVAISSADMGSSDMGSGDMGSTDMGTSDTGSNDAGRADLGGQPDTGTRPDLSEVDSGSGGEPDGSDDSSLKPDDEGCCAVVEDRSSSGPIALLFAILLAWRRRD